MSASYDELKQVWGVAGLIRFYDVRLFFAVPPRDVLETRVRQDGSLGTTDRWYVQGRSARHVSLPYMASWTNLSICFRTRANAEIAETKLLLLLPAMIAEYEQGRTR